MDSAMDQDVTVTIVFNSEKGTMNTLDYKPHKYYSYAAELNEDRCST